MSSPNLPAMTQPTAITSSKKNVKDWIQSDEFKAQVAVALPQHVTPERFIRMVLNAFMRTPKLFECTQESVFRCCLDLSALGLEPDGRRAHLIPFAKNYKDDKGKWQKEMQCQLILDYKGIVELVMRTGTISNIHADLVCENDDFEYEFGQVTKHRIDWRKDRGAVYAVYSRVQFKDGSLHCQVMSRAEVDAVRARSKAKDDGPWVTDWPEMAKKTVFKRQSKWLTWEPEKQALIDRADDDRPDYVPQLREGGVIDLGAFLPSADPNRGHGAEVPHVSESELKEQVEQKRAAVQKMHDALPDLESFPEPGDYRPGDKVKVRGDIWLRALEGSTTEWEPWRAE